jgi:ABC-type Zn uptake system ZnuABC Zn-binding protein ZnuA
MNIKSCVMVFYFVYKSFARTVAKARVRMRALVTGAADLVSDIS